MKTVRTDETKGIVFAGCSFTWGQGLYYYSNLSTLKEPGMYRYNDSLVTDAQKRYMEAVRYPRLVANHFNTFEIVSYHNGGSDAVSFDFLKKVFNLVPSGVSAHLFTEVINPKEVEYIVFQTSQPDRNPYYYEFEGETHLYRLHLPETYDKFHEYLLKNDIPAEVAYQDLVSTTFKKIKECLQFYEGYGIKTLVLHWENEYLEPTFNDPWMKKRLITMEYKGQPYNSIRHLMTKNREMEIGEDYRYFITPPADGHPSLDCQRVLADAVIKKINETR
jgi:hypothetical protein